VKDIKSKLQDFSTKMRTKLRPGSKCKSWNKNKNMTSANNVFSFSSNVFHVLSKNGSVNCLSTLSK
jgi:hypothetical protein